MKQSRTHNCNELRLSDAGKKVTLCGWYENMRKVSKTLGFLILRDLEFTMLRWEVPNICAWKIALTKNGNPITSMGMCCLMMQKMPKKA